MRTRSGTVPRWVGATAAAALVLLAGCANDPGQPAPLDVPAPGPARLVGDAVTAQCPAWGSTEIPDSYRPVAVPVSRTGEDVVVQGKVLDAASCRAVAGARIEFWHAGADGVYVDGNRGTTYSDEAGSFVLNLSTPGTYEAAPAHVHLLVSADGYVYRAFTVPTPGPANEAFPVLETGTAL